LTRIRQVGRIEITLAGNADEADVTSGLGEGGSEPMGCRRIADRADHSVRGYPITGGVNERRESGG